MSRPRQIEQDDILDAAEAVIGRDGVAKLTLDAVAQEAGISKASVIYDHKSKHQLMRAIVARQMERERSKLRRAIELRGNKSDAALHGLLAIVREKIDENERSVAFNLCAALTQDSEVFEMIKDFYSEIIKEVEACASNRRLTLIAFLALEGLRAIEWHNFHRWDEETRAELLEDIELLLAGKLHGRHDE
ncbi:TetR/AcrR family transcriptional regulator [Limoniibacter endophyticus]|uniref:TetR family transcriptional regulator n=1 Tax=Limoniibacter endophyticus TaxID=1565040 RepID=A0A8J3GHW3_9HYPH|nr:TetR/AcrR family transcriptional regulator [Limoniibacter endophyticus]GHC77590.1 TetR family transcriptional regulator [Limoniibacter endophyticus]